MTHAYMKTPFKTAALLCLLAMFSSASFAEGERTPTDPLLEAAFEDSHEGSRASTPQKKAPDSNEGPSSDFFRLGTLHCHHEARSFWTRLPGLSRWAKKERKSAQGEHFPSKKGPDFQVLPFSSGQYQLKVVSESTGVQTTTQPAQLRTLKSYETQDLKWPKRWLNKLKHVQAKAVYEGTWSASDSRQPPWKLKLVKVQKKRKGKLVTEIFGTATLDEQGHSGSYDVECTESGS